MVGVPDNEDMTVKVIYKNTSPLKDEHGNVLYTLKVEKEDAYYGGRSKSSKKGRFTDLAKANNACRKVLYFNS